MNKQHLYTSLFLALSSAYLSACSSVAAEKHTFSGEQQQQLAAERAGHLRQTHVRFNALDKDENGYISRAEFNRSGDSAFSRMDTNQDGVISKADPKPAPRGEDTRSEQTRLQQQQASQQGPGLPLPVIGFLAIRSDQHFRNHAGIVHLIGCERPDEVERVIAVIAEVLVEGRESNHPAQRLTIGPCNGVVFALDIRDYYGTGMIQQIRDDGPDAFARSCGSEGEQVTRLVEAQMPPLCLADDRPAFEQSGLPHIE